MRFLPFLIQRIGLTYDRWQNHNTFYLLCIATKYAEVEVLGAAKHLHFGIFTT